MMQVLLGTAGAAAVALARSGTCLAFELANYG
jgi:hypothetical protein